MGLRIGRALSLPRSEQIPDQQLSEATVCPAGDCGLRGVCCVGCDLLLNHGQPHPKSGLAVGGFGGDRALMGLDNRVDNRET
jgi:hypothetical protein